MLPREQGYTLAKSQFKCKRATYVATHLADLDPNRRLFHMRKRTENAQIHIIRSYESVIRYDTECSDFLEAYVHGSAEHGPARMEIEVLGMNTERMESKANERCVVTCRVYKS